MSVELDHTHDPDRTSWVESANGHSDFPIQNLPLGLFSPSDGGPRPGCAIGDQILDLAALATAGLATQGVADALGQANLNPLLAVTGGERTDLRRSLSHLLSTPAERSRLEPLLHAADSCRMHLPARIGDYTDFYVGIHHATNIGLLFRPDSPLLPNYKYVPIGYHGRASSVQVSGVPVLRPFGQTKSSGADAPEFGASGRLDYELELGVWIGGTNPLGQAVPIGGAHKRIAGFCLLNDWSARDLQTWEYQPLGPFLAKSFHTTVSPWILTAEALAPFRVAQPARPAGDPKPLPYLWDEGDQASGALSIELSVSLTTARMRDEGSAPSILSRGGSRDAMYWTVAQLVAHHASNGCNLNPGDLFGTGTLSAASPKGFGSLIELTHGGAAAITLSNGETRTFLEDGDELTLTASARAPGRVSIGFGECRARIMDHAPLAQSRGAKCT